MATSGPTRLSLARRLPAAALAGAIAAVLLAAGIAQHAYLRGRLMDAQVASMRADMVAARDDVERIPRLSSQTARGLLCTPAAGARGENPAREYARALSAAAGRTGAVVIYDNALNVLALTESPEAGLSVPLPPRLPATELRRAEGGRESSPVLLSVAGGPEQLGVAFPIDLGAARPCGVAQLSLPTAPVREVLDGERGFLVLTGALLVATAAAARLAWSLRRRWRRARG